MKLIGKILRWVLTITIGLEIILHIYNPVIRKNSTDTIVLTPDRKLELKSMSVPEQDVTVSTNSYGFRGHNAEEKSSNRIFCMGGSTTECPYLNDGDDWPSLLLKSLKKQDSSIWLNNAGLPGLKSSQYLKLFKQHILPLKPTCIILMSGLDDITLTATKVNDNKDENWLSKAYHFLEIPKTLKVLINGNPHHTSQNSAFHHYLDLNKAETMEMNDSQILQRIAREQPMVQLYAENLQKLADECKVNHIRLVLVSQPVLFGDEKDLVTNVDLGKVKTGDINGKAEALLLKQYNKVTYETADKNKLDFINLSARLPKDSRFFYDGYHFTKEGSEIVSDMIYDEVKHLMKK